MNTIQLTKAIHLDPYTSQYVVGVFASNKLPKVTKLSMGLIGNLSPSTSDGTHWIAIYIDYNKQGEYFCSYGQEPKVYKKFLNANCKDWTCNQERVQNALSSACGQHCLFYLMNRCRGLSMKEIQDLYSDDYDYNDEMVTQLVNCYFGFDLSVYNVPFVNEQINKMLG